MNNTDKLFNLILAFVLLIVLSGCGSDKPQKYRKYDSGMETGVRIELLLKGGGSVILVCPKLPSRPLGAHGRECYIDGSIKGN